MTIGSEIASSDFNAIRADTISILGNGIGQRGYGQVIASAPVFAGNTITAAQWDLLKLDLINIKLHQDGTLPPITTITPGDVVQYSAGSPNFNYRLVADQAVSNRFNVGVGQSTVSTGTTVSRTGSWTTQSQCTVTVTFNGYTRGSDSAIISPTDHARYFFNSGGKLRFSSNRSGGSSTQQNNAWTNLLNTTVGAIEFGAVTPALVNFYSLTTSYQQVYQISLSTPYSSNYYLIEALCDCSEPTNVNGTATELTFRITWRDDYVDPGNAPADVPNTDDIVNGTLTIIVDDIIASGILLPSGTFEMESPTYSASSITSS